MLKQYTQLESRMYEGLFEDTTIIEVKAPDGKVYHHHVSTTFLFSEMVELEEQYMKRGYKIFK